MIRDLKACFIFNPNSGHNARHPYLLERARKFVAANHLDATVITTERPHHAREIAKRAADDGCGLVVAIGGDGTMNEIASVLVGSEVMLGLIPCGSGNGLGRHLGIYGPGKGAFTTLLNGEPRSIDTGMANGFPFFNAMGLGFDAEISHRFNRLAQRGLGAYVRTALNAYSHFRPQSYTISAGQTKLQTNAFIVSIANSDQYGNDCFIAPGAQIDDGQLEMTVLKNVNMFNVVPIAVRLFTRTIEGSRQVQRISGSQFIIKRPCPGLIHTDGETYETDSTVEITVRPRSLRIMVPTETD